MYKVGFKGPEEPEIKLPAFVGSWRKQGSSRRTSTFASLTMLKLLTVLITTTCAIFLKRWLNQTTLPVSWVTCMQVKRKQLEPDWFQIGKGVHEGCILSPWLFNCYTEYIMQNVGLDESQTGIKIDRRNINNLRYVDDTTLMAESEEELKNLLMRVKRRVKELAWNSTLKKWIS